MIFSKKNIRTTSIPTRHSMIGSPERVKIQRSSIPKIRMISGNWKLQTKNLQNCHFWPKNGQILAANGQILAISEFSRNIHYDFLKQDHKGSFHTKSQKIYSGVWKIQAKNTQKWLFWPKMAKFVPFLAILGVKKFFDRKNFWWSSKSYGDTTSCKKLEKNIER